MVTVSSANSRERALYQTTAPQSLERNSGAQPCARARASAEGGRSTADTLAASAAAAAAEERDDDEVDDVAVVEAGAAR